MYLNHFELKEKPFDQLPDPDFLYLTQQHEEALSRMQFALAIDDSFTVVTGEIGSGKTTLIRKLLSDMADECVPAFITHTRLDDVELLQLILVEFGIRPFGMGKSEMITEIRKFVTSTQESGRRVVIVVDEAQNFSIDVLEELRLLTCMDSEDERAINIVLVGQPQLSSTLSSPDLEQLRQRCRLRFHLNGLSEAETAEYIKHRLDIAGASRDEIFDEIAILSIYENSKGVPRLINTLCDTSMMLACLAGKENITIESVEEAVRELDWSASGNSSTMTEQDDLSTESIAHVAIMKGGKIEDGHILSLPSYVLGRADDCSFVIKSRYLSRHHALISHDEKGWLISDLNSTNGIKVNGRHVKSWRLQCGDFVDVGEYVLKFTLQDSAKRDARNTSEPVAVNGTRDYLPAEASPEIDPGSATARIDVELPDLL